MTSYSRGSTLEGNTALEGRFLQSQGERFTAYYDEFFDRVYRYVYRRVGARDADDVTSEVFTKAWRGFAGFRGPSFAAWIFRIAHAQVTDLLRRRGRAPQEDRSMADAERLPAPDVAHTVETDLILAACLDRLPEYQRAVVELRFFADLRHQDIARVLGKREGAVKVALQRALLKLHDELSQDKEVLL